MKKQCYMTAGERHQLEAMRRNKIPIAEIARQLNRSRQTIYNELRRGSYLHTVDYQDVVRYSAASAESETKGGTGDPRAGVKVQGPQDQDGERHQLYGLPRIHDLKGKVFSCGGVGRGQSGGLHHDDLRDDTV